MSSKPKPKPEAITHWQKEQFLREFNDREEVFFLELAKEVFQKVIPYVVIYISFAISAPLDSGL